MTKPLDKIVAFHSHEWERLVLSGWMTIKVYKFGVAILRFNPMVKTT